ncbi:MAG TPA: gluconate 2-dehydrogenase subunit 3 family protein [Terriglobia bacterium]|nr:gluconate 2-dehydrogenase subunit 3 family protein [Terriglobia bacterium]
MQKPQIGRRRALKYFGLLGATAAGREFLEGWLPRGSATMASPAPAAGGLHQIQEIGPSPSPADTESPYVPRFFKPDEFRTVEVLTEMILPTDEKPGAKEAKVANYIDFVVYSASEFEPSLQKQWIDGLGLTNQLSDKQFGEPFLQLSPVQQEDLLTQMSVPEHDPNARHAGFPFYRLLKGMTLEAFFTSKVGLVDFLDYQGLAFLTSFPGCTHPEHQT